MHLKTRNRCQPGRLLRWTAFACVFLVLLLAGVEATHAHSEVASVRSSPCAICLSVHANAPAITLHLLPTLSALEALVQPSLMQGHGIQTEISLFTRPPPSV